LPPPPSGQRLDTFPRIADENDECGCTDTFHTFADHDDSCRDPNRFGHERDRYPDQRNAREIKEDESEESEDEPKSNVLKLTPPMRDEFGRNAREIKEDESEVSEDEPTSKFLKMTPPKELVQGLGQGEGYKRGTFEGRLDVATNTANVWWFGDHHTI
jgi:hypothetical protein